MSLIPYDPFRYFKKMQKEMELLTQHAMGAFSVRFEDTEDQLVAICSAPDLKRKEEIQIDVLNNVLIVLRNTDSLYEMKGQNTYKREQFKGQFRQTFPLPYHITSWKTTFSNGELRVHMVKSKA